MSTSPMHRPFLVSRKVGRPGLHLVQPLKNKKSHDFDRSNRFYKIAAVGAALFLVFTTC